MISWRRFCFLVEVGSAKRRLHRRIVRARARMKEIGRCDDLLARLDALERELLTL